MEAPLSTINFLFPAGGMPARQHHMIASQPGKGISLQDILKSLPRVRGGNYWLGTADVHIRITQRQRIVLAVAKAARVDSLLDLAVTAATTGQHASDITPLVVTESLGDWQEKIKACDRKPKFVSPDEFLRMWQSNPRSLRIGARYTLLVVDRVQRDWNITPHVIVDLASQPRYSALITTTPEYGIYLAHNIQSAQIVIDAMTAEDVQTLIGEAAPADFQSGNGQFCLHDGIRWRTFDTATQP
jgi:hypothetical protein